jgi:hypothetical protein
MAPEKPEHWAQGKRVEHLLVKLLEKPWDDHEQAVRDLGPDLPDGLRDCHAYSLFWFSTKVKLRKQGPFMGSFTADTAAALHTWLFHLLGGEHSNLLPPPANDDPEGKKLSNKIRVQCKQAGNKYCAALERLRKSANSLAAEELETLRNGRVRDDWLRKQSDAGGNAETKQRAAASPPDPTPPDAVEAELRRRAACCLAFAMGTHERLGIASRVREISGDHDVMRLIAKHAELRTTDWIAQPPPKEQRRLRHLNWQMELELQAERSSVSALNIALADMQRALTRHFEREVAMAARLQRVEEKFSKQLDRQSKSHQVNSFPPHLALPRPASPCPVLAPAQPTPPYSHRQRSDHWS